MSLGEGRVKEAIDRYADANHKLREFVHTVSENTTRSGHTDKADQPGGRGDVDQRRPPDREGGRCGHLPGPRPDRDLEGFVYLAQTLPAASRTSCDTSSPSGWRPPTRPPTSTASDQGDRRGANDKFTQAQLGLGKFIELVQKSTQDAQHPANPISAATATSWTTTAQQIQAVIGALIQ